MSDEAIRSNLRHAGWSEMQVEEGLIAADQKNNTPLNNPAPFVDESQGIVGLSGSDLEEKNAPSRKKMLKIGALMLAGFLVIGGGILGFYLINPTLTKYLALKDLGKIESGRFQGRIVMKETGGGVDGKSADDFALKFLLDGYLDSKEMKSDFVAKMEVPAGYISPEVNLVTVKDKIYFRISKFPFPDTPGQPAIQDTWYFYDSAEEKKEKDAQRNESESKNQDIELGKYFSTGKIFKDFRKVSDEKVGGVDCRQYAFELDMGKLAETIIKVSSESGALMTESEKLKLKNELQEIHSIKGSLLIGKEDKTIHRTDIYLVSKEVTLDITLKISEINQKHSFKEPEGAKSYQDTFGIKDKPLPIFPGSESSARSPI
ncbi:hypothetical protein C4544_00305 [candidate division WS5 bacterium]|uniref:Uncharacterized protein n=1 Tax=candidate division WS5 bacterium TaxID=2093353 RepID=A0A419DGM1_9BACT|nr:MAG: hypothetical protein C4544_00305 [candidate division WS5 bacterium]